MDRRRKRRCASRYAAFHELARPERTLVILDRTALDRTPSAVLVLASELRVRALVETARTDAAREAARDYLARFPTGSAREWMTRLADDERARVVSPAPP